MQFEVKRLKEEIREIKIDNQDVKYSLLALQTRVQRLKEKETNSSIKIRI